MTQSEIDARRVRLPLSTLRSTIVGPAGLEIAHEFGVLAREDHLQRRRRRYGKTADANRLMAAPQPGDAARHERK
jgi:hypothetical protein